MKLTALLFLPLLCAGADRPMDVAALADRARSAPPEFAADALIRIASLDGLEKARRVGLLEEAFRLGSGARDTLRMRPFQVKFEGPTGFLEKASKQGLDAQTLQLRAVEVLLALDRAKARELFLSLTPPDPPKLDCKAALLPDVSRYYTVLGRVAGETYSAKEIADEEPFKLLMRCLNVKSAAQVAAVAQVLASAKLTEPQFSALLGQYIAGLKAVDSDDRTFTYWRGSGTAIHELVAATAKQGISTIPLLETYRAYLVRHMTAARCAESGRLGIKVVIESVAYQVEKAEQALSPAGYFNDSLRVAAIPPITAAEEKASKQEGEAEGIKGCVSPECQAIGKQYRALVLKPDNVPYTPAEQRGAEWQNRLREYLSAVADWKQDTGETDAEHFRHKCSIYSELVAVVPPGQTRDTVLRATLQFLEQTRNSVARPAEWFLPANILVGRVAMDPVSLGAFRADLEGSGDAVISLYENLERLVPRPPGDIMPLM